MNERIEELESKVDHQEQYSRKNCILIHGITENKRENTDQQAIDFINDNLDIKMTRLKFINPSGLDVLTRQTKAKLIIVKFARYNVRTRVFREERKLKVTGKSITESLATKRIDQLNDTREKYGFNNVWFYDGKILYKVNNEVKVYHDEQLMAVNIYGKMLFLFNIWYCTFNNMF